MAFFEGAGNKKEFLKYRDNIIICENYIKQDLDLIEQQSQEIIDKLLKMDKDKILKYLYIFD